VRTGANAFGRRAHDGVCVLQPMRKALAAVEAGQGQKARGLRCASGLLAIAASYLNGTLSPPPPRSSWAHGLVRLLLQHSEMGKEGLVGIASV
jgi:hypothetical protein